MFTIYGKEDCGFCQKIKLVLELLGKEYVYKEIYTDFTEEEFLAKFKGKTAFPQVEFDGKHIGDCQQTIQYLKDHRVLT